jgi:GNAT superfamily N-acetyltransferase
LERDRASIIASVDWRSLPPGSLYSAATVADVTALLHEAYAAHLANGIRFATATQESDTTLRRLASATSLIGVSDEVVVAVGVLYERVSSLAGLPDWFTRPDVAVFAQLAVLPRVQRCGIGSEMLEIFERQALSWEKRHLACDTAEPAQDLVAYYNRRGYASIGCFQYPDASYRSVVLSKELS